MREAMHLTIFLIALGVAVVTHASQNAITAKGLRFLGVGYNILKGNPDGGNLTHGGADPGLLFARKIFKLTWDTRKTSVDGKFRVPDQVAFVHRSSCVENTTNEVFSGVKSYQEKLKKDVEVSDDIDAGLWNAAFSLSSGYEEIKTETTQNEKVFFEKKKVCCLGTAQYLLDSALDSARVEKRSVTNDFATAVCNLPEPYDQGTYRTFLDNWGTDIVVKVKLGNKTSERQESSYAKFVKYAMENVESSVSVSASGGRSYVSVDIKKFQESNTDSTNFTENKVVFSSGGQDLPEPIGLQLIPIHNAVKDSFFSILDQRYRCRNLVQRRDNVKRILREYPEILGVAKPQHIGLAMARSIRRRRDPTVRIPLTWPAGTYGLPMPKSGCPKGRFWYPWPGTRYHDTENNDSSNDWSKRCYDLAGYVGLDNMEQKFCMKIRTGNSYDLPWPRGQYCICKKYQCPPGFDQGYIRWDDEDDNNKNRPINGHQHADLPDGSYDRNTVIYYCCRNDGLATNRIYLPIDTPFVLLKSGYHQCQEVYGIDFREEYFFWDSEDNSPDTQKHGKHPFAEIDDQKNLKIHYCYYERGLARLPSNTC